MNFFGRVMPTWAKPALIAIAAAVVIGGLLWYRASLIELGRVQVRAEWARAVKTATDLQAKNNTEATAALVVEVEVEKVVYRDRIKEVAKYVRTPNTNCPTDSEFERLFNAASPASNTNSK